MPSDIRSFFGGKPAGAPAPAPKKKARGRKVVDDDEDDEAIPKVKVTPKKAKKEPSPEPEEVSTTDYFKSNGKPKRSAETVRPKTAGKPKADESSVKATPKKAKTNGKAAKETPRSSDRKKQSTSYIELDENDFPDDDMEDDADGVHKAAIPATRMRDDYKEELDNEDDAPLVPQKRSSGKQKKLKDEDDDFEEDGHVTMHDTKPEDDFVVPDDDEMIVEDKPAPKAKASKKRKSAALEEDDENDLEVEEVKPKKKRAAPTKKSTPAKKAKQEEPKEDSAELKAIFDSVPTVEAPPPPDQSGEGDGEKKKFQYGQHANSAVPAAAISADEMPQGAENCLAGLTFVFTGQLQRIGREQGQALVKQYGGKVTGAPSKKTSYVVLGDDAGPKKLVTIKQYGLKTINEDGLFYLIKSLPANGGDSVAAEKQAEKIEKEENKIRDQAAEMEKQERARLAAKPKPMTNGSSKGKESANGPDTRLWTVRYAPQNVNQICGNKGQVEKLQKWLRAFPKSQRTKFKMPGPDGSGIYRAVMIHGPPGIGKTTAAHLVAKLEGYDIVESNASDTRSKKLVESGLKGVLSTTSLMGYFGTGGNDVEEGKKKLVLIMDEVDGMSAGDRGGVGALAAVCKKSQIPMILICNDRKLPKMKPFDFVTYDMPFRRPTTDMIRSRISTIAFREGLKMPPNVINALIEGSGADIRQVVNMVSTAKLDQESMSFEDSKDMSKAWEKHVILKPWDITGKILGGGLFNAASNSKLNDKIELYFNDHEFSPLMLQENYLGTNPILSNNPSFSAREKKLKVLGLVSKAADSISDGDLVDRMIHGSQQQWSLMPTHAVFSFVRPASFVAGSMAGHSTRFTAWLGKNSNQGKLTRMVKEIQGHMRLRTSGDRHEIRQNYLPVLWNMLVKRLEAEGKESVPEIIELMDSYFLTRDDWDAIMELGVGEYDMEKIKIESQSKATFTRLYVFPLPKSHQTTPTDFHGRYNAQSHPLPFMKASSIAAPKKTSKERPDLEEALDDLDDDEGGAADEGDAAAGANAEEEEDVDLSKDKYVKQPKKKRAPAKAAAVKAGKGKRKKGEEDEQEEESDVPKKKGKGKGRAKK